VWKTALTGRARSDSKNEVRTARTESRPSRIWPVALRRSDRWTEPQGGAAAVFPKHTGILDRQRKFSQR